MVLEVVDEFGILAIFSRQDLLELKNGGVKLLGPVTFEDFAEGLTGEAG